MTTVDIITYLSYLAFLAAAVLIIICIVFFKKHKIKDVYLEYKGKKMQKEITRLTQKNAPAMQKQDAASEPSEIVIRGAKAETGFAQTNSLGRTSTGFTAATAPTKVAGPNTARTGKTVSDTTGFAAQKPAQVITPKTAPEVKQTAPAQNLSPLETATVKDQGESDEEGTIVLTENEQQQENLSPIDTASAGISTADDEADESGTMVLSEEEQQHGNLSPIDSASAEASTADDEADEGGTMVLNEEEQQHENLSPIDSASAEASTADDEADEGGTMVLNEEEQHHENLSPIDSASAEASTDDDEADEGGTMVLSEDEQQKENISPLDAASTQNQPRKEAYAESPLETAASFVPQKQAEPEASWESLSPSKSEEAEQTPESSSIPVTFVEDTQPSSIKKNVKVSRLVYGSGKYAPKLNVYSEDADDSIDAEEDLPEDYKSETEEPAAKEIGFTITSDEKSVSSDSLPK